MSRNIAATEAIKSRHSQRRTLMYAPPGTPTLDCQNCGDTVKVLTDAEAQMVALDPYNYIAYCHDCGEAIESEGCFEVDRPYLRP